MNETPDNSAAIEAHGVSYTYQEGTLALDGVSLTFRRGEFVALLASNGSGKSTLIKTIVGLLKPQQGHIRIDGLPLESLDDRALYSKAGVVFQNPDDQLFAPTVGEDVAFGPRNLGLTEEEVERRVAEALAAVDAAHLRRKAIHHLSFGEKKRVSLAGVLAMRPSILILDEPTAGLDPMGEVGMMRLLSALNCERGVTVLLATHSVDMLPLFADRVVVLKKGRVLKQGSAQETFTDLEMLTQAGLRLPYISSLLHEMKMHDGVPIDGLPLTIGEARKRMLELIPEELLIRRVADGAP